MTIAPEASTWRRVLDSRPVLSPRVRAFREALRLPIDQPIVMSGHQAAIWHPGILAKYIAAAHARSVFGAAAAWVVVDQDPEDFTSIRVPARTRADASTAGRLESRSVRLISEEIAALLATDHAPCAIGPVPVRDSAAALTQALAGDATAIDSIALGVERIASALRDAGQGTISAAQQVSAAVASLVAPIVPPLPTLFASALARTEFVGWLLSVMRDDPSRCVKAYNDAVVGFPRAGIAALAERASSGTSPHRDCELPLWRISPTEPRRQRVWASELSTIPRAELAPRALLLTAILRLGACDLFIHGTGGGGHTGASGYDAVTDDWIANWLGVTASPLAPTATVTATLRLPLANVPLPGERQVAHARWLAHHARHDGAFLGPDAARAKQQALAVMDSQATRPARRAAYADMHRALAAARDVHAPHLKALDEQASNLARLRAAGAVADDRTWAFPLYAPAALAALSETIKTRLTGV